MVDRRPPVAPLVFHVGGLLAEPPGATRAYQIAGVTLALDDDLRLADPLEGAIRLVRTNRGLLVSGTLRTALAETCSRCLTPVDVPLELTIEEEALPSVDLASGDPIADDEDPDILRLTDHHELDLEAAVRGAISLAEPIAPLCRADCAGLCPTCGERLADGAHDHPDEDLDPRLAVLRGFVVDGTAETE